MVGWMDALCRVHLLWCPQKRLLCRDVAKKSRACIFAVWCVRWGVMVRERSCLNVSKMLVWSWLATWLMMLWRTVRLLPVTPNNRIISIKTHRYLSPCMFCINSYTYIRRRNTSNLYSRLYIPTIMWLFCRDESYCVVHDVTNYFWIIGMRLHRHIRGNYFDGRRDRAGLVQATSSGGWWKFHNFIIHYKTTVRKPQIQMVVSLFSLSVSVSVSYWIVCLLCVVC